RAATRSGSSRRPAPAARRLCRPSPPARAPCHCPSRPFGFGLPPGAASTMRPPRKGATCGRDLLLLLAAAGGAAGPARRDGPGPGRGDRGQRVQVGKPPRPPLLLLRREDRRGGLVPGRGDPPVAALDDR